jgi:hypothetical protein
MNFTLLTVVVFGVTAIVMGVVGVLFPQQFLDELGVTSSVVMMSASSMGALNMGIYYLWAVWHRNYLFIYYTVPFRILTFCVFFYLSTSIPKLIQVALWEGTGAILTLIGLIWDRDTLTFVVNPDATFNPKSVAEFLSDHEHAANVLIRSNPLVTSVRAVNDEKTIFSITDRIGFYSIDYEAQIIFRSNGWDSSVRAPGRTSITNNVTFVDIFDFRQAKSSYKPIEVIQITAPILFLWYAKSTATKAHNEMFMTLSQKIGR